MSKVTVEGQMGERYVHSVARRKHLVADAKGDVALMQAANVKEAVCIVKVRNVEGAMVSAGSVINTLDKAAEVYRFLGVPATAATLVKDRTDVYVHTIQRAKDLALPVVDPDVKPARKAKVVAWLPLEQVKRTA